MRLRRVRNDLRGTDFAELMHLVGRYVDVHFAGDGRDVEFGRVCEVDALPGAYACEDVALPEECRRVDAHAPSIAAPEPPMSELYACAPGAVREDVDFAPTARPLAASAAPRRDALFSSRASQRAASLAPSYAPADLGDLLRDLDAGFTQTLLRLIDERGFSDAQVYKRANISRQLFSKIRKDDSYRPTKQTALALGVALELELDELATLLERAGYALTHSSKADIIVEYFVTHGCYDVQVINEALYAFDQPLLGSSAA